MADTQTFVIVGASLAGAKAAETLRQEGFTGRIVLVGAEPEIPYERPPLSKGYLLGKDPRDKAYVHPAEWYDEQRIELRLGSRATALDTAQHRVELSTGETLEYAKLLLTTGSEVRRLDVRGSYFDGVLYLRTLDDSDRIRQRLAEGRRLVVVGAGWIGLEVAAAAREHGMDVTVVEMADLPLQRVLGDEIAATFAALHRSHGVEFRFGTGVSEFRGQGGQLSSVVTDDGTQLPADVAVVGVGIRPATQLAEAAGLEVDNGVVVDESLRTSDSDVYAAGDVANAYHPLYHRRIRVEHWANALNQGPAAARSMLGQQVSFDRPPYFFTDQYDLGMEYSGYVAPDESAQVVTRGDLEGGTFQAFWLRDGVVSAAMHANMWEPGIDPLREMVAGRRKVDPARLADPSIELSDV